MGILIDGQWVTDDEVARTNADGEWRRTPSSIRNWITGDGSAGPTGKGGFAAETGRYHLYAAWNCPWAHRVLLARTELGLESAIGVSFVRPRRTDQGWSFAPDEGYRDDLFAAAALHQLYTRSDPHYSGRVTVPLLWDKQGGEAVSNESADIVRMLNDGFRGETRIDLYPDELADEIDAWNARIYSNVNNGVYRARFAGSQEAYDTAVAAVFETLDAIEEVLARQDYLAGDRFTEADLRLLPTLFRFDAAYYQAFKCSRNRLIDFPGLWRYARRQYHRPGIADTVKFDIYRASYNAPNAKRNPLGIVPAAPEIDWRL